jgi:ribosome maturation factor RimP
MNCKMKIRVPAIVSVAFSIALLFGALPLCAQAPARFVGSITAIENNTLTVKTDAGAQHQVQVTADTPIKRIAPGSRDLSNAETLQLSNLAVGDRVLVKLSSEAGGTVEQAAQIIAIKQSDVALKQQKENEEWQKRGAGGLVKSIDAGTGVIVLSTGFGSTAKTVTIHVTKDTVLKRYAEASVSYDAAQPAPISTIQRGDQLRARGTKSADGTEVTAEEVVSGSFRNISGRIVSLDAAAGTIVVKDLATKKPVTIHVGANTQMRRLPDRMAEMLATRLQGNQQTPMGMGSPAAAPGGVQSGGGPSSGDSQQLLSRAPSIQLADLTKTEAVMLVSTEGSTEVTAITLLAGVEPLLQAPEATNLLSSWSMSTSASANAQ